MSVNKQRAHIIVLPEDDANRQLANGFHEQVDWSRYRQMQVLPECGGWTHVIDDFLSDHVAVMNRYPSRLMVLLMDCDGNRERLQRVRERIPNDLAERVFVLGALTEPEDLRTDLGFPETVGAAIAQDCRENTNTALEHRLLRHNARELARLRERAVPILFPAI
ncbi:MAG TPA: hypothetical protein VJW20_21305 [Candidatus Angelobacter sp.]|nr:hypothetical protein [Candidatus Angelobacter sp.]